MVWKPLVSAKKKLLFGDIRNNSGKDLGLVSSSDTVASLNMRSDTNYLVLCHTVNSS